MEINEYETMPLKNILHALQSKSSIFIRKSMKSIKWLNTWTVKKFTDTGLSHYC